MTLDEILARFKASEQYMTENLSRQFYADAEYFGWKKPTAWQAFKYRVVSKVKAAVRWATYWAWADHIS